MINGCAPRHLRLRIIMSRLLRRLGPVLRFAWTMNEDRVRCLGQTFVTLEDVKMATEKKSPTKAEFLEALKKKGINNLEDLADAVMPETGGYRSINRSIKRFNSMFSFWAEMAEENDWPEQFYSHVPDDIA